MSAAEPLDLDDLPEEERTWRGRFWSEVTSVQTWVAMIALAALWGLSVVVSVAVQP